MTGPVTALILTKNEEAGIERCVRAAQLCCDQVIVVDSASSDATVALARSAGAEVVNFEWNGAYPKKKQWGMNLPQIRHDWVLHLDADEIVGAALAAEVVRIVSDHGAAPIAYDIPLAYRFDGKTLRHGHKVLKRSLIRKDRCEFPVMPDLDAPGITEVEGHYQPDAHGEVGILASRLLHDDPDPIASWIGRHNRYSDWEAHLRVHSNARLKVREHKSSQGRLFDRLPGKPLIFFIYSYVIRLGFLDGRSGFNYAYGLAWYYWLIGVKVRELTDPRT